MGEETNIIDNKEKLNKALDLLCEMTMQADEDTPSENRTRHFRETMDECYDFLAKQGTLELN